MTYNNEQFLIEAIKMLAANYLANMAECDIKADVIEDTTSKIAREAVKTIKLVEKQYQVKE